MENFKFEKSYFDTITERFSCREFTEQSISDELLNIILESGRIAPSAVNFYPTKIMVIENHELLERLKEATKYTFNSKLILVIMHDKNLSWHRRTDNKDHGQIDSTIVATHMMLACTALGLGSTYVSAFKDDVLREILDIADNYEINCMLPIGYPKEIKPHNTRKALEDIIIYKK